MNIFILDMDMKKSAQYHVDKHVVKMPLETAQLLCAAHHVCGSCHLSDVPYKLTHKNHPCSKWTRSSIDNYMWLCNFGIELCREYTYRYEKVHKCESVIRWCSQHLPQIYEEGFTEFAQAVPEEHKDNDAVVAYRKYYCEDKQRLFSWKKREQPDWI